MGTKEREEVLTTGIENIFNKVVAENSPDIGKQMVIQVQETLRTPNRQNFCKVY
jgi:hypothetical protein